MMKMMKSNVLLIALGVMLAFAGIATAASVDVIQYPTPQFVDPLNPSANYRYFSQDWGWTHNPMAETPITVATLSIGAYDVDWDPTSAGEHDLIYAYDDGVKTLLGELGGGNNIWQYTPFPLGANFYNDIAAGLVVFMDIDSTHTVDTWAVSLSKSSLSINGGINPDPTPGGPVPEPGTMMLLGSGLVGLVGWGRNKFRK